MSGWLPCRGMMRTATVLPAGMGSGSESAVEHQGMAGSGMVAAPWGSAHHVVEVWLNLVRRSWIAKPPDDARNGARRSLRFDQPGCGKRRCAGQPNTDAPDVA